jgi:prepilin-type N-terminal cleavage/methylation domain-containing protein
MEITRVPASAQDERGFSLIEVMAAMLILTAGLLPLAGLFATAVQQMGASTPMMQAREKAREAVESVHAARDTGTVSWAMIRNVADGGRFLDIATAIKDPGPDGLVNTADDGAEQMSASEFTREIDIVPVNLDGTANPNPQLREIRVIIRYKVNQAWRDYTLITYISSYS